ncbi:hypothetical protein BT93_J0129 [Corymbia citriodora subsp. variegata]|nr:hypothetical protein BT93_J0129 [Corymbia citriodora subsp. variegata]
MVINGVLVSKDTRDLFHRSPNTEVDCNNRFRTLKRVLSHSFDDMSYHLKSCFLHLNVFPKGCLFKHRLSKVSGTISSLNL